MKKDKTELTVMTATPTEPVENGQSLKDNVLTKFAFVALLLIGLAIGLMFYWGTQNGPVIDVKNAPFPTRTIREHPTAGGVVILSVDYCKTREIEGDLRISFVSPSREIFLPITRERGPKGCNKSEVPILIPKDIPADTYKIKFRILYDINPLKQNVEESFESQEVIVDESVTNPDRQTQLTQ